MQSSTQEIGEELEDGVIYSISLRKVQLHHTANKGQRWLGVSSSCHRGGFRCFPAMGIVYLFGSREWEHLLSSATWGGAQVTQSAAPF